MNFEKNMTLVNVVTLTLWHLTSLTFDVRCATDNTKLRLLKAAPRTCQLEEIFVEPCGICAVPQLVCVVNPTERGDILIRIFENSSGIKGLG